MFSFLENRRDELFRGPDLKLVLAISVYHVLGTLGYGTLIIYPPLTE